AMTHALSTLGARLAGNERADRLGRVAGALPVRLHERQPALRALDHLQSVAALADRVLRHLRNCNLDLHVSLALALTQRLAHARGHLVRVELAHDGPAHELHPDTRRDLQRADVRLTVDGCDRAHHAAIRCDARADF